MTKNPFYNALFAIAYIVIIVTFLFFGPGAIMGDEESIFIPMAMLSLLVLSVALMGYIFFYHPVLMLIQGERERGVKLFLQTVGIFAIATLVVLIVALIVSR